MLAKGWGVTIPQAADKVVDAMRKLDSEGKRFVKNENGETAQQLANYDKLASNTATKLAAQIEVLKAIVAKSEEIYGKEFSEVSQWKVGFREQTQSQNHDHFVQQMLPALLERARLADHARQVQISKLFDTLDQSARSAPAETSAIKPRGTPYPAAPDVQPQSADVAKPQSATPHPLARLASAKAGDAAIEASHAQYIARMAGMDRGAAAQTAHIAVSSVASQIGVLRTGLRQKQIMLEAEVRQHQIGEDQKYTILEAETEREYQAERALLEKEQRLVAQKPAQIQAINAKIEQLQAQHALVMTRLDEQSIAASQKQWETYFNVVQGAFNGQIKGLIQGTTNWTSVFKSMLTDMIVRFIEGCEKMVFQWTAGELAKTTATTTGAAARAAAEGSAGAVSMASTIGNVLKSIAASAAEVFGGIFGFLSPVMGPAAIGPAAAGQASVMAASAGVAAFAQGTWQLPSDMFAQVHRGEMIVPAAQTPWAQSLMASAAGGGSAGSSGAAVHIHPTTNFHVSAIDSGSVAQWMKTNSGAMMKAMDEAVRHGAHLGLRRLAMG